MPFISLSDNFTVLLDTCVLVPMHLRDTLLRLADRGLYRVRWSPDIMEELTRTLGALEVEQAKIEHLLQEMRTAFPYAEVESYESLKESMTCDPKDRHVLAAAVKSESEAILTFNGKHFPPESTEPHRIEVLHPKEFLLDLYDLAPNAVLDELNEQAKDNTAEPNTVDSLLSALERAGVEGLADDIRRAHQARQLSGGPQVGGLPRP